MPDRVHPGVEAMQTSIAQPHFDRVPPNPKRLELPPRHHPMLPVRKLRYLLVQAARLL